MGVVYRVYDHARGKELAVKALRKLGGTALYRFKREFRVLVGLQHPNLVTLHDLYEIGGEWMYTMELVAGVPFHTWCRSPRLDEPRLRDALYQLTDGLAALHAAGKLHRDLKPSNVLVEPGGRVVLLDFGLVADRSMLESEHTHDEAAVGTPAYMSPEQASDHPLDEATDWYAVGVILYETLTGRRPFEGVPSHVMLQKRRQPPPPPGQFAPGIPADLERLCLALLEPDPTTRAGATQVLEVLGRELSPATARVARGAIRAPLVGRDAELATLGKALADSRDHMVLCLITGPAGSGKTALLEGFTDRVRRAGAVSLPGRAVEREVIPLRALDPIVDAVSGYLMRMSRDELEAIVPPDISLLTRLFPVLRRVPALAGPSLPNGHGETPIGGDEELYRASRALATLLDHLARSRPLLVAMDDMQWADEREVALIHRYEGPDAPRILLLLAIRTGSPEADRVLGHYLAFRGDLRRIEL